ncbi:cytochrome P450 52D1 [Culex quinquefasciatus]|uniref:Cytochrome P450 52D1 n=1 Tax=Culex quinquefasciatus TaxID=7176 RepID=B0X3S7_CULQU|nr:cytochrome P450 52D1 [Culex quinquefasciatus]|eukprot:XP_001864299.1 cytochrome P450 52D1 [Culex quinquefasciatus]
MNAFAWIIALALLALALYLLYRWGTANYDYFEQRRVPYVLPSSTFGRMLTGKLHPVDAAGEGYRVYPDERFSGFFVFRQPGYLIHDPELVKQITIKDFDHFVDHSFNISPELDPFLGRSLFFESGASWKHGRIGLSPAFTGSKMRNMFELLTSYCEGAMRRLVESAEGRIEKEVKDLFQRFGNDIMASISFGMDIDSVRDPDNVFYQKGKRFTATTGIQGLKFFLVTLGGEKLLKWLGIRLTPRDVADFYLDVVSRTIKYREENSVVRPDFIHLLLQARKNILHHDQHDEKLDSAGFSTVEEHLKSTSEDSKQWTDLDIAAAAASFFFGGIETTTTMLCFAIYEISLNPDIQHKLREEIDAVQQELGDGRLTYEAMQRMKYLDMVVTETLRKWPPFGVLTRKCNKQYVMENGDGTKVTIEKGGHVQFSVHAIQRDPQYYPDPMRFDPERFSDENRHLINQDTFLPFGSGPRNCIGSRLALMQAKCLLYYLFRYFTVEISERTDVPLRLDNTALGLSAKNGFWFYLIPREI